MFRQVFFIRLTEKNVQELQNAKKHGIMEATKIPFTGGKYYGCIRKRPGDSL